MHSHSDHPPSGHSSAFAVALSRLALGLLLGAAVWQAHGGPLTPDEALRLAQARSQQLPAQAAAAAAARDMGVAAQIATATAQLARWIDVSVELMFNQRGSAYSNMVSVNLSVPLQWDQDNRQDREVAAKLAGVAQARAEREEATRTPAKRSKARRAGA